MCRIRKNTFMAKKHKKTGGETPPVLNILLLIKGRTAKR